jgi:hypothetical protein
MYSCPPCADKAIPDEFREAVEALICGFSGGKGPEPAAAAAFADILGIGAEYRHLLSIKRTGKEMRHFLEHFQNNLDLLIQKTWVEKADEVRKEKLQDRVPGFIEEIEQGNFQDALRNFGAILEELAYLLFGAQSAKDDFTEYTMRIDMQMGLFWWYGGRLSGIVDSLRNTAETPNNESLWAVLLIGLCYLTNF